MKVKESIIELTANSQDFGSDLNRKVSSAWRQVIDHLYCSKDSKKQWESLQWLKDKEIRNPSMVRAYHDAILFISAFPAEKELYCLAQEELNRMKAVLEIKKNNSRWQYSLSGSGLPFTEMRGQYSLAQAAWLLEIHPHTVRPGEATGTGQNFQLLCQAILPGIEFYEINKGIAEIWKKIKGLGGEFKNAAAMRWLLQLLHQAKIPIHLRDQLYDDLKIYLSWELTGSLDNRSFLRAPSYSNYFSNQLTLNQNINLLIRKPIGESLKLNKKEARKWIDVARSSLALYYRETDPVTFADPSETFVFDMGKGFLILLTGMEKERRLSLDSYIGFMAFRNGVPIAYGGGWIFGYSCRIGINIYPPFRGAASGYLFCEVLRLYSHRYRIKKFIVKPNQFGKGNPEGLKSGAFWFYYKLGFRPEKPLVREIAEKEWEKIKSGKKYRTPIEILRHFTGSKIVWQPFNIKDQFIDSEEVSKLVTNMIKVNYHGDRQLAKTDAVRKLRLEFKLIRNLPSERVMENWSLLLNCLPGWQEWTYLQKKQLFMLMWDKSNEQELKFIIHLQQHKTLWRSLKKI